MSKLFALFFALLFAIGIRGGWLNHRKWAIGMIGRDLSSQNDLRVIEDEDVHDQQTIADYVKEIDRLRALLQRAYDSESDMPWLWVEDARKELENK